MGLTVFARNALKVVPQLIREQGDEVIPVAESCLHFCKAVL